MKKTVQMFRSYPFFFKPIQDGTTNPRMELAFREPSKRITKKNKTSNRGDALNTVINWKNTTNNAYDGEKLHMLYMDEAGKWEKPVDIRDAWRIERTCLIVGRKVVGKALVGSTVNPMDKGAGNIGHYGLTAILKSVTPTDEPKWIVQDLHPSISSFRGFFDRHGNAVVDDPVEPIMGSMEKKSKSELSPT